MTHVFILLSRSIRRTLVEISNVEKYERKAGSRKGEHEVDYMVG